MIAALSSTSSPRVVIAEHARRRRELGRAQRQRPPSGRCLWRHDVLGELSDTGAAPPLPSKTLRFLPHRNADGRYRLLCRRAGRVSGPVGRAIGHLTEGGAQPGLERVLVDVDAQGTIFSLHGALSAGLVSTLAIRLSFPRGFPSGEYSRLGLVGALAIAAPRDRISLRGIRLPGERCWKSFGRLVDVQQDVQPPRGVVECATCR